MMVLEVALIRFADTLMGLRKERHKGEAGVFLYICMCSCLCSGTQVSAHVCIWIEARGQPSVLSGMLSTYFERVSLIGCKLTS